MEEDTLLRLRTTCIDVRRDILTEVHFGGSGHVGGCLSCVEIMTVLFCEIMRLRPEQPDWPDRDRFVLSKGHAAPTLYAVMAERGFFPKDELKTFTQPDTRLQKHVDMHRIPGIDVSSGSLGQGLSISIGMALADRMDQKDRRVYCVIGDGENQEGQIWEAAMSAAQFKVENLILYLDYNKLQVDGFLKDIVELEPVEDKWRSFGWHVQRIDGHSLTQLLAATAIAHATHDRPHVIICETVKGKGISFMENKIEWHSHAINDSEYDQALIELEAAQKKMTVPEASHAV